MKKEIIGNCELYCGAMEEIIGSIKYANHILSDPPYLYIKTHDFDKEFDEWLLFENAKRLLPDNGFIALFGRGTSFYRWNTMLAELGFVFKEEIVWSKNLITSPCLALSRVHELVSIHTVKKGKIRRVKIPYVEARNYDVEKMYGDIKKIGCLIKNETIFKETIDFLETNKLKEKPIKIKHCVVHQGSIKNADRGMLTLKSIRDGINEKSIINCTPDHYTALHPTQKPVRLMERLINLISDEGDLILDPFMGSGSTGLACVNLNRKYIGIEVNEAYFDIACKRIKDTQGCLNFYGRESESGKLF